MNDVPTENVPVPPAPGSRMGVPDPQTTPEAGEVVPGVIAVAVATTSWARKTPVVVIETLQLTFFVSVDDITNIRTVVNDE